MAFGQTKLVFYINKFKLAVKYTLFLLFVLFVWEMRVSVCVMCAFKRERGRKNCSGNGRAIKFTLSPSSSSVSQFI